MSWPAVGRWAVQAGVILVPMLAVVGAVWLVSRAPLMLLALVALAVLGARVAAHLAAEE